MRDAVLWGMLAAVLMTACGGGSSGGNEGIPGTGDPGGPGDNPGGPPPAADVFADYGTALNILPPGQDDGGGLENAALPAPLPVDPLFEAITTFSQQTGIAPALAEEPHFQDQLPLYANLVYADPGLTNTQLTQYFKPAPLRAPDVGTWESEATRTNGEFSVQIKRDDFGVPHIYGDTREDALFGAGYVTVADRLFLFDVLRHAGRGELSQFLGPADFSFDRDIARAAPYTEAERTQQIIETAARYEVGAQILRDLDAFVAGLNKAAADMRAGLLELPIEYLLLGVGTGTPPGPAPFVREDVHAIATLIQSIFAGGGGGEAANLRLLYALQDATGDEQTACALWRDIRHASDPASTVTITDSFATQSPNVLDDDICPLLPAFAAAYPGAAVFDAGSYQAHDFFKTEPCGRPGQTTCPGGAQGNLPQLPVVESLADLVLNTLLGGLPLASDKPQRVTRLAAARSDPDAAAARQRIAALRESLSRGLGGLAEALPRRISNALLVSAAHTASGNPIAVFGPQTAYFAPQLLLEMDIHGGNLHARGMTFTGLPYVVIGRGPDFAWSATSGSSDLTDVRVVRLCPANAGEPRSGYLVNGACKPFIQFTDTWSARWNLAVPMDDPASIGQNVKVTRDIIRTQEYGPVFAFATVDGMPVALASQRSTFGAELDTAVPFYLATSGAVTDAASFLQVFNKTTGSFNWFYIDAENIAYIHSGLYPLRPPTVHPDVPAWGDGSHDWQGFLNFARHPQAIDPERGYLASWNNRPARGWWAADANASYGPVHRNDMLEVRLQDLKAAGNVTRADVVEAMADAATVDLRGQEVLPAALDVLETGPLTPAQTEAVALLRDWIAAGAMRRDRDRDGQYDAQAAVALMDAWYNPMIEAVLPRIVAVEAFMIQGRNNAPGPRGSAYQSGYYGYLRRVFDMALDRAATPYRQLECAGPGAGDCQAALAASLDAALASLGGIGNRANWNADEASDQIVHRPIGLATVPPIHWQNRPTFQQVVEFQRTME